MVAVTDRFTLSSLVLSDMRSTLRELIRGLRLEMQASLMQKPHRFVIDRVSGYADEAAAYVRRRRLTRKPFARVYSSAGNGTSHGADTDEGRELFLAAAALIDVSRP